MAGAITMNHSESYKLQIITKYLSGKLFKSEAATLLNVSERTISRYAKKIREAGPIGAKQLICRLKNTLILIQLTLLIF